MRISNTIGVTFMYVAVPAQDGALRIAVPMSDIRSKVNDIRAQLLTAVTVAFLPAMILAAMYMDPSQREEAAAWTRGLADAMYPDETAGYAGFITDEGERGARRAYPPATLARLQEVKRRYDPDNLFHLNHNIPPAEG